MLVGLVEVMTGPEPPQAPQAKDPRLRGARPSSARNWCSWFAKAPMASALLLEGRLRAMRGGLESGREGSGGAVVAWCTCTRKEVEWGVCVLLLRKGRKETKEKRVGGAGSAGVHETTRCETESVGFLFGDEKKSFLLTTKRQLFY